MTDELTLEQIEKLNQMESVKSFRKWTNYNLHVHCLLTWTVRVQVIVDQCRFT